MVIDIRAIFMKIAIVGLGYVGLPLSLQFTRSGVNVLGLDIDAAKVTSLNAGKSYIKHIEASDIASAVKSGAFAASTDFERIREVEAVIICVGSNRRLTRTGEAGHRNRISWDTGFVDGALSAKKRTLVVLESTTYPGTTDEDLLAVLEKGSGMKAGVDFHLAFSPEREDPANPASKVADIPKVVGGFTLGLPGTGQNTLWQSDQDDCPGLFLPRGGGDQAVGEHFPQREHRAGE